MSLLFFPGLVSQRFLDREQNVFCQTQELNVSLLGQQTGHRWEVHRKVSLDTFTARPS